MSRRRGGGAGGSRVSGFIGVGIMAFIAIMFVLGIGPELETAIGATTITNTFTLAILNLVEWALPIGLLVGAIVWSIKLIRG